MRLGVHNRAIYVPKRKPTLKSLKAKCWKIFSQYIRRKDADAGGTVACYTCGSLMFWKQADAGHALPGRHNAVLFDEDIVKPQCKVCNIWKRGNYPVFTVKLIREHGLPWFDAKLEGSRQVVKFTRSDIEDLIALYKAKLEML